VETPDHVSVGPPDRRLLCTASSKARIALRHRFCRRVWRITSMPTNPVRVIEAFVDALDLDALGFAVIPAVTGRPGYHPTRDALRAALYLGPGAASKKRATSSGLMTMGTLRGSCT
jgi:hypothetical protein